MTSPTIGVKFTGDTDGVAVAVRELTDQIRSLGDAGKKTGSELSKLTNGLASLGTTIGAARLGRLVQDAIDTGDAIYKLSQKTGASTETLSVLALAGKTAEVSLEDLGTMLKFLSKSLGELQRGDPNTVAAFHAIGLEAKDLKGLSIDQALLKIANAQQNFADGTGKAEVVLKLFGRAGTEIIPLLNDLAGGGFDRAAESATRLGVVWSRDAAKGAQDFNDSIIVLKASAEGLAGSFASEVTPGITAFLQGTTKFLSELPGPTKQVVTNLVAVEAGILGVAGAIRILSIAFTAARLTTPLGILLTGLGAVAAVLLTFAHNADEAKQKYSDFLGTLKTTQEVDVERSHLEGQLRDAEAQLVGARQAAQQAKVDQGAQQPRSPIVDDLFRQHATAPSASPAPVALPGILKDARIQSAAADAARVGQEATPAIRAAEARVAQLREQLDALAKRRAELGEKDKKSVVVPDPALITARRAAEQAAVQQELQLQQEYLRAQEVLNQQQYDHGQKGIAAYYDKRKELIQRGVAAEVKALEDERKIIEKTPATTAAEKVKKEADLKKGGRIDQQILKVQTQGETRTNELTGQRVDAERALAEERLGFESRIMQAQGRTLQAALAGIDQEARKYDELLAKQGVDPSERQARVNQFRAVFGARAQVDDVSQQAQRAFAEIDTERERIAQQVSVGALTEQAGQEKLAALETARLPGLRALADQMQQFAVQLKDPALIQAAQQLSVQVDGIAAAADLASQRAAKFRSDVLEAGKGALTNFLDTSVEQLGQPNPNSGAIEVRQRQAEEIQRQINEANTAAADGDQAAAARVRQLTAEYDALQSKIASLKTETFGLDDAMRQLFVDILDGIRKALDQLIASDIINGIGKALTPKQASAPKDVAVQGTETAAQTAALTAASAGVTAAAGALTGAGASVGVGAAPVTASGTVLATSAGALSASGSILLAAAAELQVAAAALAAANAIGGSFIGLAEGGPVGGVGSSTSDSNLIWASRGEFMQPNRAVRHYGLRFMRDVQHLRYPKFATGGLIGEASLAGVQASLIAPSIRVPSAPRVPDIPEDATLRRTELAGEIHLGLERGIVMDTIRSYMGSKYAEEDHIRLSAATKSRRRGAGT